MQYTCIPELSLIVVQKFLAVTALMEALGAVPSFDLKFHCKHHWSLKLHVYK